MLKQLKDILQQPPSQDMVSLVDMLSGEAGGLVQELHGKVETCMRLEQFDLVEQIVTCSSEYEELQKRAERWKASAAGGATGPAASPAAARSPQAAPPLPPPPTDSLGPLGGASPAVSRGASGQIGRIPSSSSSSIGAAQPTMSREEQGSGMGRSAISEAQRRQEEEEQAEADRFGTFPSIDERLPAQSELGGLPAFNSSASRRSAAPAAPTPSRLKDQRRNEALQTLKTTLEGSMREDPTVLQWALSEAQQAGVADVDPSLVSEGERALEQVNANQRQQLALQKLHAAVDQNPPDINSLREAIDDARTAGVPAERLEPALAALQREEGRQQAAKQREEDEQRKGQEAEERDRKLADDLRKRKLQDLRDAVHEGDPGELSRAITVARKAGVAPGAIKGADSHLLAVRFAMRRVDKRPVLRAWREHIAGLKSGREALRDALHRGAGADELEDAVDFAGKAGVDQTTCDMGRNVANHRRTAHDRAAAALGSMDLEELHEAKAMNEAAGGPRSDVGHLTHAIAEAEELARMVRSWDAGLPDAVDRYFDQLDLEQQEAKARIDKANAAKRAEEEARKAATASMPPPGPSSPLASQTTVLASSPLPQTSVRSAASLGMEPLRTTTEARGRPATPPISRPEIRPEDEEDWEREYVSMKSKVERARKWFSQQERQQQHEEMMQQFQSHLQRSEAATQHWSDGSKRQYLADTPPRSGGKEGELRHHQQHSQAHRRLPSRRRQCCGPGDEDEPPAPRTPPRTEMATQPRSAETREQVTQLPGSEIRGQASARVIPTRRRHVCGPGGEDRSAASPPRTEALPSTARPPMQQDHGTPPRSAPLRDPYSDYRGVAGTPVDHGTPPRTAPLRGPHGDHHGVAETPVDRTQVLRRRRQLCGPGPEEGGQSPSTMPRTEASSSRAQPPAQDRYTPPQTAPWQHDPYASYHSGMAGVPVDKTQVYDMPSYQRSTASMPVEEAPTLLGRTPAGIRAGPQAMPQSARPLGQASRAAAAAAPGSGPPAQSARALTQALPSRRRMICGPDAEEAPFPGLPEATAQAAEPRVQASRNLPSRYKPGHSSMEDLGYAPATTQPPSQAKQSRPVLLGQQQPPPYALQYGATPATAYADPGPPSSDYPYPSNGAAFPSSPGGPSGPAPVPMVPGADAGGGSGYSYGSYEELRGTSTFHDMMANAARMARKPEMEPRRHYEDPTFWR